MQIKKAIKNILPRKIFDSLRDALYPKKIDILENRINSLFLTHYQGLTASHLSQKLAFKNAEFKVYSKHGTDGILAHILSKIVPADCTFVEMGVEAGKECNTANLSLNFGWQGLLIDANEEWIKSAKAFYKERLGNRSGNVRIITSFVSAENINQTLKDGGLTGDIDLLSIDIDGNDYWVWQAISVVNPRVVVIEYNPALGFRPLTIKYSSGHRYDPHHDHPLYFGASLSALAKLGKKKGYALVACDSYGQDAFFVRSDVVKDKFAELSPEEAFYPNPYTVARIGNIEKQFELIKHLEFEEV